jgi:CRP/FNR family cyclic AMP-dependent transcriptional regulator
VHSLKGRKVELERTPGFCRVLLEDAGLAEVIPEQLRRSAVQECVAGVAVIPRGSWDGHGSAMPDGIGLLVLDGLLIRHVGIAAGYGAELLGEGDLLRPWQEHDAQPALPHTTGWRVLEPTRLAVLDRQAAQRMAQYPELTGRLVGRALERSRNLAVNMAIVQQSRVQTRLHMLMWHLANRWGYVRADGVILPMALTHSVLSDLVAARRPTVSVTLSAMAKAKLVRRVPEGWLLAGTPPGELLALQPRDLDDEDGGSLATSGRSRVGLQRATRRRAAGADRSPPQTGRNAR